MTLRFAALWLMLAGLLAGVVLALSVAPAPLIELMGEEGPVERLTGIGFSCSRRWCGCCAGAATRSPR